MNNLLNVMVAAAQAVNFGNVSNAKDVIDSIIALGAEIKMDGDEVRYIIFGGNVTRIGTLRFIPLIDNHQKDARL